MRLKTSHGHLFGTLVVAAALLVSACAAQEEAPPASTATVYQGARVIVGDGGVIENATFVVDGGQFTMVGPVGAVTVPEGSATVDLTGMTVMPMMVDTHTHLSTEREALIQDLRRRAYWGISAAMSMGMDPEPWQPDFRNEVIPGAARYRFAGRGITRPEPGRTEVPHWVDTVEEAQAAVQEEVDRGVDLVKIWVDDRNGMYDKLTPELYGAIIDAAHAAGIRVTAHIFALEDAKGLLRAGIDSFAHSIRDTDLDDEAMALFAEHPDVVLIPNLPGRGVPGDLSFLEGVLPADQYAQLQEGNVENADAQEAFGIQARNLARLTAAGVTIALGTDGNTPWGPHQEIEDMVAAGMSPADALVAATGDAAAYLRLADTGTVEAGKSADFVVLQANPLDDITNTRRIADVYLRGTEVDRTSMP